MTEDTQHFAFHKFKQGQLRTMTSKRDGEIKIGQSLSNKDDAKYVIIGVEESVGVLANNGQPGAENGFSAFLSTFLDMQANESLAGDEVYILGKITQQNIPESGLNEVVEELDEFLFSILKEYIGENQIPIVIGGGHNNAYPVIRFSADRYQDPIQVVNLDAHADYRPLEGRHSGNSFSYAFHNGLIDKYYVLGLHQRYNSQLILNNLREDDHYYTFHEQYILGDRNYYDDFITWCDILGAANKYIGIELDLDAIERMPSSASSPVGIPIDLGRAYLIRMAKLKKVAYLHLAEGGPNNDEEKRIVGKTLAYLVTDFIRVHS